MDFLKKRFFKPFDFTGFEIISLSKFGFNFEILIQVFYLSQMRRSIRAYSMPASFLALARTLSHCTDIIVSETMQSFLDLLQYFF
jgi:hypothetical protein